MAKIITVIGNVGVGKTTLTKVLAHEFNWVNCSEQHSDRPFQRKLLVDPRFGFANQMDYLLLRAEQEYEIRHGTKNGIFDGGLDLDFHVFTRLFHQNGYLDADEFALIERFYRFTRQTLPHPDLVINLAADESTIAARYQARERINIAKPEDMRQINLLLEIYNGLKLSKNTLQFDVSNSSPHFPEIVRAINESDLVL